MRWDVEWILREYVMILGILTLVLTSGVAQSKFIEWGAIKVFNIVCMCQNTSWGLIHDRWFTRSVCVDYDQWYFTEVML